MEWCVGHWKGGWLGGGVMDAVQNWRDQGVMERGGESDIVFADRN